MLDGAIHAVCKSKLTQSLLFQQEVISEATCRWKGKCSIHSISSVATACPWYEKESNYSVHVRLHVVHDICTAKTRELCMYWKSVDVFERQKHALYIAPVCCRHVCMYLSNLCPIF